MTRSKDSPFLDEGGTWKITYAEQIIGQSTLPSSAGDGYLGQKGNTHAIRILVWVVKPIKVDQTSRLTYDNIEFENSNLC